jgi:hypothetical protein
MVGVRVVAPGIRGLLVLRVVHGLVHRVIHVHGVIMMRIIVRRGGREWHCQKGGRDERERGGYETLGRRHVLNYLVNSN